MNVLPSFPCLRGTAVLGGLALATCAALAAAPRAQGLVPGVPFSHTRGAYVSDSTADKIYQLDDLDLDGDYNDPNETRVFYDDTVGPFALTNNNGIAIGFAGAVYVSDSNTDVIIALRDLDGDGSAHGAGEATLFFDGRPGGNASGIVMTSSNTTSGVDSVIQLRDINLNGHANDAGEAIEYWVHATPTPAGASLPQDLAIGVDGHLYVLDIPSTAGTQKGLYRCNDLNSNGVIDGASEYSAFFIPPAGAEAAFYWGLGSDAAGNFYFADTGNDLIWKARDADASGAIDPGEFAPYWTGAPDSSQIWRVAVGSDGSLLCAESEDPNRLLSMRDADNDGQIRAGEVSVVYDETIAPVVIGNPRSVCWARRPTIVASDSTPSIGNPLGYTTIATAGELVLGWYSLALGAPIPFAPFGSIELSLLPVHNPTQLYAGLIGPSGQHVFTLPVPNSPSLVGLDFHVQGLVGTLARLQLSNVASVVVSL
jgi:hypothetical protein